MKTLNNAKLAPYLLKVVDPFELDIILLYVRYRRLRYRLRRQPLYVKIAVIHGLIAVTQITAFPPPAGASMFTIPLIWALSYFLALFVSNIFFAPPHPVAKAPQNQSLPVRGG